MLNLETLELKRGNHKSSEDGLCAMEAVAYFAGEPHTDRPKCASPVLTMYVQKLNDSMDDETREKLKPYIMRLIGTNNGKEQEQERAKVLAWAAVTEFAPFALEKSGLTEGAARLRNLPLYDWAAAAKAAEAAEAAARAAKAEEAETATARAAWTAEAAAGAAGDAVWAAWSAGARTGAMTAWAAAAAAGAAETEVWDMALSALDKALAVK